MNKLTKQVLKEIKIWEDYTDSSALQEMFGEVLDIYIAANHPEGAKNDTLMCSIHNSFKEGHNCVGCNLQEQSNLLIKFLAGFKSFKDLQLAVTQFHLLLYLLAARYNTYIEYIQLQQPVRHKDYGIFQKITHWANFLKHPKSFVLAHHPGFVIDGLEYDKDITIDIPGPIKIDRCTIDDDFVKTYYAGTENNGKLNGKLAKKEGVLVVFPNAIHLIKQFTLAQKKFVDMIRDNAIVREMLENEATIKEIFAEEKAA
jgi:hypothetical protein